MIEIHASYFRTLSSESIFYNSDSAMNEL